MLREEPAWPLSGQEESLGVEADDSSGRPGWTAAPGLLCLPEIPAQKRARSPRGGQFFQPRSGLCFLSVRSQQGVLGQTGALGASWSPRDRPGLFLAAMRQDMYRAGRSLGVLDVF